MFYFNLTISEFTLYFSPITLNLNKIPPDRFDSDPFFSNGLTGLGGFGGFGGGFGGLGGGFGNDFGGGSLFSSSFGNGGGSLLVGTI